MPDQPTTEQLAADVDDRDSTISSLRADLDFQTKAAFANQAEANRLAATVEEKEALLAQAYDHNAELQERRDRLAATIRAIPDAHHAANLAHTRAQRDRFAATVKAAYAFADEMAGYCSPYGVSSMYAKRLREALDKTGGGAASGSSRRAQEPTDADLLLESAWGVIANVGNPLGDWDSMSQQWREAAVQWARGYHAWLDERAAGESQTSEPTLNSVLSPLTILAVKVEALSAHLKHGPKALTNPDMPVLEKLAALVEECGEVGRALTYDQDHAEPLVKELIQVASVALSWVESIEGGKA